MRPEKNQNIALSDREKLIKQALSCIMKLNETERKAILSQYAERYWWELEL